MLKNPVRLMIYLLPTLVFLALVVFFLLGLEKDPRLVKPVLIDKPVAEFSLPGLPDVGDGLSSADLKGKVSLINVFGSWCEACVAEHPMLMRIKESGKVPLYGIDWRDKPANALAWLKKHGNPYDRIGFDPDSRVAIDFGVTGAPETFVIDKAGVIRYKWSGPITEAVWRDILLPLVEELAR